MSTSEPATVSDAWDLLTKDQQKRMFLFLLEIALFYGDPDTWWATALLEDRPSGAINRDYRIDPEGKHRPGGRARLAIHWIWSALRRTGSPVDVDAPKVP